MCICVSVLCVCVCVSVCVCLECMQVSVCKFNCSLQKDEPAICIQRVIKDGLCHLQST